MIHSGGSHMPGLIGMIADNGKYGVQIFFLLSGYLAFKSLSNFYTNNSDKWASLKWIGMKLIKLIPLYYLSILLYSVVPLIENKGVAENNISFGNILTHVTFTSGLFPQYCNSIINVEWYMGVLALFYFISPILFRIINNIYRAIMAFIVGSLGSLVSYHFLMRFLPYVESSEAYETYVGTFCITSQIGVLLLGIVLFFVLKKECTLLPDKEKIITSYFLILFSVVLIVGTMLDRNYVLGINKFGLFGICFFIMAYALNMHACKIVDNVVFRFLGRKSYFIYLFHFLLIRLYDKYVPVITGNEFINWIIKYVLVLIIVVALSYPVEKYFEKPLVAVMNKAIRKDGNF